LVRRLAKLPGDLRIRLSSIEATEVTRELIDVMADRPDKVCPHLHISMQSGSDSVLRRMRRRWGSRRFVDRCNLLRERLDQPAITTDVIVGFPGETDTEFEETLAVCREAGFSKIHGFPFSRRRGTPAWDLPDQTENSVKKPRIHPSAQSHPDLRDPHPAPPPRTPPPAPTHTPPAPRGSAWRYSPVEIPGSTAQSGGFVDLTATAVQRERLLGEPL